MTNNKLVPSEIDGSFVRASNKGGTGPIFWGAATGTVQTEKRKYSHYLK